MITVTIEEREVIDRIIRKNVVCFVGLIDLKGNPYVIPMNFGYEGDTLYLHSGPESSSVEALKKNPNVCITFSEGHELIHQNEEVACSYRMKSSSVICRGKVVFENDFDKKKECLAIIMKQYSDRDFKYSDPAVRNVLIWKVEIEEVSSKIFGTPHKNSKNYKEGEELY